VREEARERLGRRARDEVGVRLVDGDDLAARVALHVERVEPGPVVLIVAVIEDAAFVLGPGAAGDPSRVPSDLTVMREAFALAAPATLHPGGRRLVRPLQARDEGGVELVVGAAGRAADGALDAPRNELPAVVARDAPERVLAVCLREPLDEVRAVQV